MDVPTGIGLFAIIALVFTNAFFVATEFAIVAIRRSRLEQLVAKGSRRAKAAKDLVNHLDTYIAACQLGITLSSIALGWIGEPALASVLERPLERVVGSFAPTASHGVAIAIAFSLITALHIVLGELAPKGLALQRTEGTALLVARPMQLFFSLFRWPILLLNAVGNGVLKLLGLKPAAGHDMVHSVEELYFVLESMEKAGAIETSEGAIARRAFVYADVKAQSIMTPRSKLEALPITCTLNDAIHWARSTSHRRLVVYDGSIDNVVGMLHIGDLLRVLTDPKAAFDLHRLLRPVVTVPASKPADDLLEEMRAAHQQLAVVTDQHGKTIGIVTIEDLVEALVGKIEQEVRLSSGQPTPISRLVSDQPPLRDVTIGQPDHPV